MIIGIIGAGHMGSALWRAWRARGFKVLLYDHHYAKARALARVQAVCTLTELVRRAGCLVMAVKPQSFPALAGELKEMAAKKLVISIMAALPLKRIRTLTSTSHIIRAMPNLAVPVGAGATLWTASRNVTAAERRLVQKMFAAVGAVVAVKSEPQLDQLTAISGSGPAYFFYLTEILEQAAVQYGLPSQDAGRLARATLVGSAKLFALGKKTAAEWRQAVTSPGGITEAALKYLAQKQFDKTFWGALRRAETRTKELAKLL